jgi:ABC-2 type transport system ATP-binding protein
MLPLASNMTSPSAPSGNPARPIAGSPGVDVGAHSTTARQKMGRLNKNQDQPIVLATESLTKKYGDRVALSNLTLTVRAGEVFGYVGPNGAGKTTTFRILAGLLDPTSGVARIDGQDVTGNRDRIKQLVGYLPDNFGVYPQLRVVEYLDFFGAAYRIPRKQRKERIDFCLQIANAGEYRDKLMGSLSRGMKQRVGIAKTLLHDPSVLILDEPAATLDPRARVQMRLLLRQLAEAGKAVLVSSHILPELGDMCDTIGILTGGRMVAYGAVKDVLARVRPTRLIEIRVMGSAGAVRQTLQRAPGHWEPVPGDECDANLGVTVMRYEIEADAQQMAAGLQMLIKDGVNVMSFAELPVNLEDAFMHLTK